MGAGFGAGCGLTAGPGFGPGFEPGCTAGAGFGPGFGAGFTAGADFGVALVVFPGAYPPPGGGAGWLGGGAQNAPTVVSVATKSRLFFMRKIPSILVYAGPNDRRSIRFIRGRAALRAARSRNPCAPPR